MDSYSSAPRLYVTARLEGGQTVTIETDQTHYLKNVLRKGVGDIIRLFNGRDGEWAGEIAAIDKKSASIKLTEQTRQQPAPRKPVHVLFAPLKKDRMDFLIEKSVELGITDFHPIVTNRTEIRKINNERLLAQITEAAEQCERLDLPRLHNLIDLPASLKNWDQSVPFYACIERYDAPLLQITPAPAAFLLGPVGGFDDAERALIERHSFIKPVSLGETVLRAETAALKCLSLIA